MFEATEKVGGTTWEVWPRRAKECGRRSGPAPPRPWQLAAWPLTPGVMMSGKMVLRLKLRREPV